MSYLLHIVGATDIGMVRKRNEDSLALAPEDSIAVVADGMGGHPGGDVASRTAAESARAYLRESIALGPDADFDEATACVAQHVQQAVLGAHQAIRERGADDPELAGMGTTLTVLAAHPGSGAFGVGHVGDSRAYRLRDGELLQLTRDDTWVQERVDAQEFTPEQAKGHPFGHILTQCVGLEDEPEPQVLTGAMEEGDIYLLCTDGVMGMVEDEEFPALINPDGGGPLEAAVQRMVDLAKERGGFDNITVALVAVGSQASASPPSGG